MRRPVSALSLRVLQHPEGSATVTDLPGGERRVSVSPRDPALFIRVRECTTRYPDDLIETVLAVKGIGALCDEIEREELPGYLQNVLSWTVRAHLGADERRDRRVLDFGCGSGASTMILARMFPGSEIVGVDMDEPSLGVARARAAHYDLPAVRFARSPGAQELPAALGRFDVIVFSAVFEHLLARERAVVIPQVWSVLAPGGVLLVGETPHRWTPVELHTTGGLPLVNYLPAPLALRIARRFSPRVRADATWPELLRAGIRGGSERQLLAILRRAGVTAADAIVRRPAGRAGLRDEFDLWYAISAANELPGVKVRLRDAFRVLERLTGVSFTPYLSFAIEKARRP
jgi:SAM-dependent methyltransferase